MDPNGIKWDQIRVPYVPKWDEAQMGTNGTRTKWGQAQKAPNGQKNKTFLYFSFGFFIFHMGAI